MKKQTPAEGILKTNDWGSAQSYKVVCECGDDGHSHKLWVEADETNINVTIYTQLKSKFWCMDRWEKIWTLLSKGYIEVEECVIMTEQQTFNYANTLLSAVSEVQEFKKKHSNKGK
jgi:hypothetical protein